MPRFSADDRRRIRHGGAGAGTRRLRLDPRRHRRAGPHGRRGLRRATDLAPTSARRRGRRPRRLRRGRSSAARSTTIAGTPTPAAFVDAHRAELRRAAGLVLHQRSARRLGALRRARAGAAGQRARAGRRHPRPHDVRRRARTSDPAALLGLLRAGGPKATSATPTRSPSGSSGSSRTRASTRRWCGSIDGQALREPPRPASSYRRGASPPAWTESVCRRRAVDPSDVRSSASIDDGRPATGRAIRRT